MTENLFHKTAKIVEFMWDSSALKITEEKLQETLVGLLLHKVDFRVNSEDVRWAYKEKEGEDSEGQVCRDLYQHMSIWADHCALFSSVEKRNYAWKIENFLPFVNTLWLLLLQY